MVSNSVKNSRVIVTVDAENHVADVMLNRADKMNAVDLEMFEALGAAADTVAADRSVRAVVLRGAGDVQSPGLADHLGCAHQRPLQGLPLPLGIEAQAVEYYGAGQPEKCRG